MEDSTIIDVNCITPIIQDAMKTTLTDISEVELIEQVAKNKTEGFSLLYDSYSPVLYGVSLKIVGSETIAKAILQDSIVEIWKDFSKYDPSQCRLLTWMLNITRKTATDYAKSKEIRNESTFSFERNLSSRSGGSEMNSDHLERLKVLSSESKQVLECVYIHGNTQSEAAEILNLPLETIKTQLRNGLIEMKKTIK